jgi:hypothetical protein
VITFHVVGWVYRYIHLSHLIYELVVADNYFGACELSLYSCECFSCMCKQISRICGPVSFVLRYYFFGAEN